MTPPTGAASSPPQILISAGYIYFAAPFFEKYITGGGVWSDEASVRPPYKPKEGRLNEDKGVAARRFLKSE